MNTFLMSAKNISPFGQNMTEIYVEEVSTRFEFFQPGFAYIVVLNFIFIVLDAEFCVESNGIVFEGGYRLKSGTLPQNTAFF